MSNKVLIDSTWVRDRFNLQYNNVFSNKAPGIEDFELSMYLNSSHLEIIDEYSNGLDLFEKYRSILNGYVIEDEIEKSADDGGKVRGVDYQIFELSDDFFRIIKEYAITVENSEGIDIKPIRNDEFNKMCKNPFKKPSGSKGWRLDINYDPSENSTRDVQLFYKKMSEDDFITKYIVTYICIPDKFDMESDEIPKTLTTNLFLTEKVINRAVELASRDYKSNTLEAQIQTNNRSK